MFESCRDRQFFNDLAEEEKGWADFLLRFCSGLFQRRRSFSGRSGYENSWPLGLPSSDRLGVVVEQLCAGELILNMNDIERVAGQAVVRQQPAPPFTSRKRNVGI